VNPRIEQLKQAVEKLVDARLNMLVHQRLSKDLKASVFGMELSKHSI